MEFQEVKEQLGGVKQYFTKQLHEAIETKDKLLNDARKEIDQYQRKLLKAEADLAEAKKAATTSTTSSAHSSTQPTTSSSSEGLCCVSYKDQLTKYQVRLFLII